MQAIAGAPVVIDPLQDKLLIDGRWVDALSGATLPVVDPTTGRQIAAVAAAAAADVDRAVASSRAAFRGWKRTPPAERARLLWRVADLIEENAEELAHIEALNTGMPIDLARELCAPRCADTFRYYAGWCSKIEGSTTQTNLADVHAYTLREPFGVCAQIVPWNAPAKMASWKIAPCLATGNVSILKPAEDTPLSALFLGKLLIEAGLPAGVVNILPGYGATAGAALARHPDVDKISFTGSVQTGRAIIGAALGNMKKVALELGGKSPNIVFADADIDKAIAGSAAGIFLHCGQVCVAASRLYVQRPIFDEFIARMAEHTRAIPIGPGVTGFADLGPLVSERHMHRVKGMIEQAVADGARVACGGNRLVGNGFYIEPTILTDVTPDMAIVRDEVFGPVVVATPFDDFADMIAMANDTDYGLAASVWTRDLSKAHHFAAEIQAGVVWINTHGLLDAHLPFGGYKQSGWGREFGRESIEAYTQAKTVIAQLEPNPLD